MKDNLRWRGLAAVAIFVVVCLLGIFALLAIFAQLRFDEEKTSIGAVHQRHRAQKRQLRAHRRRGSRQGQEHHAEAATPPCSSSSVPTTRWC